MAIPDLILVGLAIVACASISAKVMMGRRRRTLLVDQQFAAAVDAGDFDLAERYARERLGVPAEAEDEASPRTAKPTRQAGGWRDEGEPPLPPWGM